MTLFSPCKLGPLTLPNRIVVSPMCQYSANDGNASDWHLQHLGHLSYSGAALIMVEATGVAKEGRITPACLGLYSDDNEKALARVITAARSFASNNPSFGIQLAHSGRKGSANVPWKGGKPLKPEEGAWTTIAPSSIPFDADWPVPAALELWQMDRLIAQFAEAAKRAVRIGFEVIEIHSAHGYLLHQFLSPLTNRRIDSYGGTLENRMRFPLELIEAVRKVVPATTALGARITGNDWVEGGFAIEDAVIYAKALKERGVDYVDVSSGAIIPKVNIPVSPGYQVPLAAKIKEESKITTRAVGMISSPYQAEAIISGGQADFVALARAFLDDPRWGWHAAEALKAEFTVPPQYLRARPPAWKSPIVYPEDQSI